MNIYFIDVEMYEEKDRWITGIHNKTNLVIAENEQEAIEIMQNLTAPYYREVKITEGVDKVVETGNGNDVQQYLDLPSFEGCTTQWECLERLHDHYVRYEYKIYDKDGEVELLNYYQHFGKDEFPTEIPKDPEASTTPKNQTN